MRSYSLLMVLAVAACSPAIPDSTSGVGFNDYNTYIKNSQDAAPAAPAAPATGFSTDAAAAAIGRASGASTPAPASNQGAVIGSNVGARPRGNAPVGIKTESGEMVHATTGVSDEQDFEAVKARETIASDKARIEKNRAQYQVDQPAALPQREGGDAPNIVQFALSSTNPVGTQIYTRSAIRLGSEAAACNKFTSSDLAQEAFLAAGGPERDRKGLDSDGDGYACDWNPAPFRTALQ